MGFLQKLGVGALAGQEDDHSYQPLLPPSSELLSEPTAMGKKLGTLRAVWLVTCCCIGSFLFAYDTGIVGGVLSLSSFERDFGYTAAQKTNVNSTAVSILQAGAFFGCFLIWPITNRLGRRYSLILCSITFCIGTTLQTINTHSLGCFYAGRVISGLGVGGVTVLVPIFSAEMAPKEIRGKLGSCFQLFFAVGVCLSYWVDYIVDVAVSSDKSAQWQIPVGLQFVPGFLVGFGMLFVKESSRWLVKKGRYQEAFKNLKWVRGGEDTDVLRAEFAEIQAGIEEELRQTEGLTLEELWLPANRYRVFISITIQLCAQLTGNTSLAYYAPQIFKAVGAGSESMFITGFFGIVKIIGCATFITFFVEQFGRKKSFMLGAFAMGSFMLILALVVATHTPKASGGVTSAGIAAIFIIYAEAFSFNMSWGPLPWLYIGEIFPSRIREIGVGLGAASQWLFNFMMSQITPHAIENIAWKTFLMFAIFNYAIIFYSHFILKEGYSLEQMEVVFGNVPDPKTTLAEEDGRSDSAAPGTQPRTIDGDTGETAKSP